MFLPKHILACMQALSDAGHKVYAVGGCVRDALLGITPHDYDLCTSATTGQMHSIFAGHRLVTSGEKHGTVGVILDHQVIEITTFRTEGGYRDNRHPDWVKFVSHVEEDLARRDFTINAMAYHPAEGYIDPFGGQADLQHHILRAVGDPAKRFTEDALRILRGVRFAVRFGLTPDTATEQAMAALAPRMESLARERVFEELCKLLPLVTAADLLRFGPVLTQVIPELSPCMGFEQHTRHHIYDVFTHTAHVVEAVPSGLALRWAALLHDIGKPPCFTMDEQGQGHFLGHAKVSAQMANDILLRLKAPTALREQVVFLITQHMTPLEPDKKLLRRRLGQYGEEGVRALLSLQKADFGSKGTGTAKEEAIFEQIDAVLEALLAEQACFSIKDLAVNGSDLLALGFASGPQIGACLSRLLTLVQDEVLPNETDVLLREAAKDL